MLEEKQVSVSELGRNISQVGSPVPGGPSPIATQAELVKSERILKQTIDQLSPQETEGSQEALTTNKIGEGLSVKIVPATNILELSYEDQDPKLATRILNTVLEVMVEKNTETIRSEARSVREFLEVEVPKQRAKAEAAEAAFNKYRQTTGLVSVEAQTNSLVDSIATLEDQERLVSAQLKETNERLNALQQVTGLNNLKNAYVGGRIGQDEELQELRTKLEDLDAKLASTRSRFTDNHPTVVSLEEERKALGTLYNEKVSRVLPENQTISPSDIASDELSQDLTSRFITAQTERLALEKRLNVLQAERRKLQNRFEQLPRIQQPLAVLARQRDEAIETLKLLQSKLEEARIAEAQLFSNIRVIEQAQFPSSPTEPNKKAVLVVAGAAGIVLAIGMMLLLEIVDNKLHDASDAEKLLDLPLLGVLPSISPSALSLERSERFLDNPGLVEPYRLLLKTLEFRTQEKLRIIVISSTVSGEGKSVVVSHLAAVSAMLSRRTLIIDADLRRPRQHSLLGVTPEPGLTNVIDHSSTLPEAVQPTDIENLSILTCGEPYSRPSALVESAEMKSLLLEAAAHYDLVIVDSPPVSSCADAHTLSQQSNGLVMIARPNFTPKDTLVRAVTQLKGNGALLLGFVVNGMTAQTEKYYRYPVDGYQPQFKPLKRLTQPEASLNGAAVPRKSVSMRGLNNVDR